ncbi:hypothetical protein [Methylomicrobium lacus]|uniref:hypothetical protein n=1 Tax=Methylomicrobium lacus TaxID=136992 RepID=UPI001377AA5E|nr:hypothetical protein [Methylomicrobium lacus]
MKRYDAISKPGESFALILVDISQQLFLDGPTEKSAAKGIDHRSFFHRLQVPPSPL